MEVITIKPLSAADYKPETVGATSIPPITAIVLYKPAIFVKNHIIFIQKLQGYFLSLILHFLIQNFIYK